jgi:hypothetical protein
VRLSPVIPCLIARGKIASDSNVWLIDDGSKDDAWALVEALAARGICSSG